MVIYCNSYTSYSTYLMKRAVWESQCENEQLLIVGRLQQTLARTLIASNTMYYVVQSSPKWYGW